MKNQLKLAVGFVGGLWIAYWLKPDQQTVNDYAVGKYTSESDLCYGLGITDEGGKQVKFYVRTTTNSGFKPSYTFNAGQWYHLTGTYDGTTIKAYVDATTGLGNVVDDTTPQLGGMLDVNGQAIGDGTLELITFVEDASIQYPFHPDFLSFG